MTEFKHVTTNAAVDAYQAGNGIFESLLKEVKELAKKNADATLNVVKVKIINRVLADLLTFLKDEPSGKYLELVDTAGPPQVSDAVFVMVQFESALESFAERYYRHIREIGETHWVTSEAIAQWTQEGWLDEDREDDSEDDDDEAEQFSDADDTEEDEEKSDEFADTDEAEEDEEDGEDEEKDEAHDADEDRDREIRH
jgi:hypothetical protein